MRGTDEVLSAPSASPKLLCLGSSPWGGAVRWVGDQGLSGRERVFVQRGCCLERGLVAGSNLGGVSGGGRAVGQENVVRHYAKTD